MFKELWKKLRPTRRRAVKQFLCMVASGRYGTGKRDIMRKAKEYFGDKIDWEAILPIILAYLPILLSFLK